MPVYQYRDDKTGCLVELVRPVADRDLAPAGLKRITVPVRIGIGGTTSTPIDPHCADASVPRGFRDLEQTMPARDIVKESGFSINDIKRIWKL